MKRDFFKNLLLLLLLLLGQKSTSKFQVTYRPSPPKLIDRLFLRELRNSLSALKIPQYIQRLALEVKIRKQYKKIK